MQPLEQRNLERVLNSHGSDISTIFCVITALIEQLKESQGDEGVERAYKKAASLASASRPMNLAPASGSTIKKLFGKN